MVTRKRKKKSRQRGSHTHSGGHKKKRRGAGNRGGRGNAGSGKRGDSKKPSLFGKRHKGGFGFKPPGYEEKTAISIRGLENRLDTLEEQGAIEKKKGVYEINLKNLGYDKLLGQGKATQKMNITVDSASESAKAKIDKAGGSLTLENVE